MAEQRFSLRWDRPFMDGGATHVTLFDGGEGPLYVVGSGHGIDDLHALVDLVKALQENRESDAAIAHVVEAYHAIVDSLPKE